MALKTPSWGIEPVPDRLRVLGLADNFLLWFSLGISLLVLVAGALIVPGLSLQAALLAILIGGLIGNAMLALSGLIGAQARVPGMVLLRAPLGRRGSYVPTALNVLQNLGWATFELIVIATAAAALSEEVFGFGAKWLWTLVFAWVMTVLAVAGPISVVRRWIRRVAFWAVIGSLVYLTWWTLDGASLGTLWDRPGKGGFPNFWQGVDLMVAMPVSWLPLIADYTRFSRSGRSAFLGSGFGYFIASTWLFALGAVLLLSRSLSDTTELMTAIAAGGVGGVLALLALTVDETDEPFANVYSTAVSMQNILPWVPQRVLVVGASAAATAGALTIQLAHYLDFLLLLGSFFVPLFGVLLAHWLLAGAHYTRDDVFRAPLIRPGQLAAWLGGFALYQWLQPVGPGWWTDLVEHANPGLVSIGASVPAFGAAFGLGVIAGIVERAVAPAASKAQA